jgi:hypothetical protein
MKSSKIRHVPLSKSWTVFNADGSIKDLGLKIIMHKESYAEWNYDKNDWDYIMVSCNCEICQETKTQSQLTLF